MLLKFYRFNSDNKDKIFEIWKQLQHNLKPL